MTDPTTTLIEVDDPRVLALAKARQQMAHESPFNVVCPPWDSLTEQEQRLSLLDARSYLRAALRAGLVPAAVPPADRAAVRQRIAAALREHWLCTNRDEADADRNMPCRCGDWREPGAEVDDENDWDAHLADAVLAVLPAPADRAAVLREAEDALKARLEDFFREWPEERQNSSWVNGWKDAMAAIRRLAAEAQPATEARAPQPDITTLAAALDGLHTLIATSSRDWQTYRVDAWLWAVLCGWDCEQAEHDDTCTHGALEETAAMHGWDSDTVAKARRYRAAVRALTDTAAGEPPATEAPRCSCTHARPMHTGPGLFCAVPGCGCAQYTAAGARQDGGQQ